MKSSTFVTRCCTIFLVLFFQLITLSYSVAEPVVNNRSTVGKSSVSDILDSLVNVVYFKDEYFSGTSKEADKYGFPATFVPQYSDSVYAARIAALKRKTTMPLVYNAHVKGFIRMYAVEKRSLTAKILGLTKIYFPLFEEKLDANNVPLEMKYLAIVESALNPTAVSPAGAKGLWQFMYGTGQMYGLQATSLVDDRYDPYKSTLAASRHLRDLYKIYDDWFLALAAYNSGPGNVNKAIRRAGGVKDYWAIWDYLPAETRGYVPAFIAVNYIMNYYNEHNIRPLQPVYLYQDTDTLRTSHPVSFEQISETIGIPTNDLQFLNPQYKVGLIPASGSGNVIRLPKKYISLFQQREQQIYAYKSAKTIERDELMARLDNFRASTTSQYSEDGKLQKVHIVEQGETLGSIARVYRTYISQLIAWNNLKDTELTPGQKLIVFSGDDTAYNNVSTKKVKKIVSYRGRRGRRAQRVEYVTVAQPEKKAVQQPIKVVRPSITVERDEMFTITQSMSIGNTAMAAGAFSEGQAPLFHIVETGQTLFSIAMMYNTTVAQLMTLNSMKDAQIIPGQKLIIGIGKTGNVPSEVKQPQPAK